MFVLDVEVDFFNIKIEKSCFVCLIVLLRVVQNGKGVNSHCITLQFVCMKDLYNKLLNITNYILQLKKFATRNLHIRVVQYSVS